MSVEAYAGIILLAAAVLRLAPFIPRDLRTPASVALVFVLLIFATWVVDDFRLFQLSRVAVLAIVAMGLNILTGYNGQISLGHGAFMLIGAYTTVILMDNESQLGFVDGAAWPFWTAIIAAGCIGGLLGFMLGFPALRLSGPYLAIATLALIISTPSVLRKYDAITGGSTGLFLSAPPPPPGLENSLNDDEWIYLLFLGVAAVMLLLAWSIVRGPIGRSFVAVRDSETAAAAMGINVARVKITAFTISAFYAGVAGALFALQNELVAPDSIRVEESINFLTAIVIGGLGSILGSVIGALILVLLGSAPEFVSKLPFVTEDFVKQSGGAIQGILVVFVILVAPYGIAGLWHRIVGGKSGDWIGGIRGIPGGIGRRMSDIRDNLIWTWEGLPWNRERALPVEPEEGGST